VPVKKRYRVVGYVRNLANGKVELVAEAEESVLKNFLSAVKESMSGYIRDVNISWQEPQGKFERFGIQF